MKKDKYLVMEGHPPAVRMSELDEMNNAGAHKNAKSFSKVDGSYIEIEDMTKPQAVDLPMNWGSADINK